MSEALGPKHAKAGASRLWRWLPMRLVVIPLGFAVVALVGLASKAFPSAHPATLALIAAFAVALFIAFSDFGPLGRRKR
jgi:hypothetical protein